jgi:flagellar basal-body rod protein FlgC
MDIGTLLQISGAALGAQKKRLEVVAENLANADVTRTADGTPYRRKDVVFKSFRDHLDAARGGQNPDLVRAEVALDPRPLPLVHDPGNPDADKDGNVRMPNVNVTEEMMNMISASRSYEANVKAIGAAKQMARAALRIGE